MDDLYKMFDGLVSQSAQNYSNTQGTRESGKWKYCVALAKLGWEAFGFDTIESQTENEVVIKWRKKGKENVHIKLGFTDQCLWIKYMEQEREKCNEGEENRK